MRLWGSEGTGDERVDGKVCESGIAGGIGNSDIKVSSILDEDLWLTKRICDEKGSFLDGLYINSP